MAEAFNSIVGFDGMDFIFVKTFH